MFRSSRSEKVTNKNKLLAYFLKKKIKKRMITESPQSLSKQIPSSCIEAANKQVTKLVLRKTTKEDCIKSIHLKKEPQLPLNLKFSNTRLYFLMRCFSF